MIGLLIAERKANGKTAKTMLVTARFFKFGGEK